MNKSVKHVLASSIILTLALVVPVLAIATEGPIEPVQPVIKTCGDTTLPATAKTACSVLNIVNILVFILQILAIVYFIWSVVKYLTAGGDAEQVTEARKSILKSILALAAIFGVAIIINALAGLFGITGIGEAIPFFGLGT